MRALGTLHHEVHCLPLCLCPEPVVSRTDPWQQSPPAHDGHHIAWVTCRKSRTRGRGKQAAQRPGGHPAFAGAASPAQAPAGPLRCATESGPEGALPGGLWGYL